MIEVVKPILNCNKLSKYYYWGRTKKCALNEVTFFAGEGDRIAVLGLNGSGKSTLIKVIAGLSKPSNGRLELYGYPVLMSFYDSILQPDLTGKENIQVYLRLNNRFGHNIENIVKEIAVFSELHEAINQPVKTYSAGMMLRLSISLFKFSNPDILLLDEVLSYGDAVFEKKIQEVLKKHLADIKLIMIATHNLEEAAMLCNKCIILENGNMVFYGGLSEGIAFYQMNNNKKLASVQLHTYKVLKECAFKNTQCEGVFKISSEIAFSVKYTKPTEERLEAVLYVRNSFQKVLTDCEIYRKSFVLKTEEPGLYELICEIPAFLLNVGHYYIDISFGNGNTEVEFVSNALSFKIIPDAWEQNRLWNTNPTFPLRPKLKWQKQRLA